MKMGGKKRTPRPVEEEQPPSDLDDHDDEPTTDSPGDAAGDDGGGVDARMVDAAAVPTTTTRKTLKPMEGRKKKRALDKERHRKASEGTGEAMKKPRVEPDRTLKSSSSSSLPPASGGLPVHLFMDLTSPDSSIREAAAAALATELRGIQDAYEKKLREGEGEDKGAVPPLEAEKDDGLENCAPPLRYAVRRLIRGVASSRECARQGFALGLTVVIGTITAVKVKSLMKLIVHFLDISSSKKGQDVRDCLLGRLFAYGALGRSSRIAAEWFSGNNTTCIKEFINNVTSLAGKKRYLREPAVSVVLDLVEKLPVEAMLSEVVEIPGMHEWFEKAPEIGDPDALFLALRLQEKIPLGSNICGRLLPLPFSPNSFFSRDHLSFLLPCFKESSFCLPRVHSLWPVLINILIPDGASHDEYASAHSNSHKKQKRSRAPSDEIVNNISCFYEVVIEGSFLLSSHDRKNLAFDVLLLLLPRLPTSCIQVVLSHKLVHCLMDILSTKGSWLYNAAQHFLKELIKWVGDDDDRRVTVAVSLQKHSNGRFDCITRTPVVKQLVTKFNTGPGCMLFVHNLMSLFVDESGLMDELSDVSQTTDENSERGSPEGKDSAGASGNTDLLKNWVVDTLPRVLKNLKLDSWTDSSGSVEIGKFLEAKFRLQAEIMKFLTVQGLFSASLGTEVTSFELQEKFTWPKAAISSSVCRLCIEQLQFLLEDAQRGDASHLASNGHESNDLGSYFICFLNTMCNIPSVSLFRNLSSEDEKAFKKLQVMEIKLCHEERSVGPGAEANKLHALRYLLIQLLLQLVLRPGELTEAVAEVIICCKKAFPGAAQIDSSEEEDEFYDNNIPQMMDVLVDTLLSLLPQSSGPLCLAVEQVFRWFCDEATDNGLVRMLHVIKKDLKPPRHQAIDTDDDEDYDEDLLGIEDAEETNEAEGAGSKDGDDYADDSETVDVVESNDGKDKINKEEPSDSDAYDSGMDDDAMFLMDSHIAKYLKERRNSSGNDSAQSQLMLFKLRVLSLLEIYLQRNPGKPQVLTVYSCLIQAFVNSHSTEGRKQLGERIGGILQKKIFKAKEYPKGEGVHLSSLETLLEKSMKLASHSRLKIVSSLAQDSTFWILKIIQSRNFSASELKRIFEIFQLTLLDYFDNKKSRLKPGFVKEIFRRHPWVGHQLFGFLLEKCGSAKSEFRRVETLELVDCTLKSLMLTNKEKMGKESSISKFLKRHMPSICELMWQLLSRFPEKQSRRAEVRRFCLRICSVFSDHGLKKTFVKKLRPEAYEACEAKLGDLFLPFKKPVQ